MLSAVDLAEIARLAASRWPGAFAATDPEVWAEWRKSLDRWEFGDVMGALILLSEEREQFPSLARLLERTRAVADERLREERPKLAPPADYGRDGRSMAMFDQSAKDARTARLAELEVFQRQSLRLGLGGLTPEQIEGERLRIMRVGVFEAAARKLLTDGHAPATAAKAMVDSFVEAVKNGGDMLRLGDPDGRMQEMPAVAEQAAVA